VAGVRIGRAGCLIPDLSYHPLIEPTGNPLLASASLGPAPSQAPRHMAIQPRPILLIGNAPAPYFYDTATNPGNIRRKPCGRLPLQSTALTAGHADSLHQRVFGHRETPSIPKTNVCVRARGGSDASVQHDVADKAPGDPSFTISHRLAREVNSQYHTAHRKAKPASERIGHRRGSNFRQRASRQNYSYLKNQRVRPLLCIPRWCRSRRTGARRWHESKRRGLPRPGGVPPHKPVWR